MASKEFQIYKSLLMDSAGFLGFVTLYKHLVSPQVYEVIKCATCAVIV